MKHCSLITKANYGQAPQAIIQSHILTTGSVRVRSRQTALPSYEEATSPSPDSQLSQCFDADVLLTVANVQVDLPVFICITLLSVVTLFSIICMFTCIPHMLACHALIAT